MVTLLDVIALYRHLTLHAMNTAVRRTVYTLWIVFIAQAARSTRFHQQGEYMDSLPPGPSSTLLSTIKIGKSPFEFYRHCYETYGPTFTIPALNGTVVCTTEPEGARAMFTAGAEHFKPFGVDVASSIIPNSIFMLEGARHKQERKLLAPPFHGARMKYYAEAMRAAALETIGTWSIDQRLSILNELQHISLDVILQAIFGVERSEAFFDRYRQGVCSLVEAFSPSFLFFKILQHEFGGFGPFAKFKRAEAEFDQLIYEVIKTRRARDERGVDVLSLLIDAKYEDGGVMDDAMIRDELITLLVAGHETTSITMAWAINHLMRNPEVMAKLRAEVEALPEGHSAEDCIELPYLTAVCQETLRLHPVLSEIIRELQKPLEIDGYQVPAGHCVAAIFSVIHTREDLFEDPLTFKPERFLDARLPSHQYFPFGGAPRRCIGSAFAMFEMKIVLATLLRHCRFELESRETVETVRRNLVMGPQSDFQIRLTHLEL